MVIAFVRACTFENWVIKKKPKRKEKNQKKILIP
jgi:hypothetical protein